ncbi:AI-2E family transporter [Salinarchaeum chitinilyticum]
MLVATALLAAVVLQAVLATSFLALTVVVVVRPLYRWLVDRGVQRHVASAITTTCVFLGVVALAAPIAYVLYQRRADVITVVEDLPGEVPIGLGGVEYTVETAEVQAYLVEYVSDVALRVLASTPDLMLHLTLFTVVIFGVLLGQRRVGAAIDTLVPSAYQEVYEAIAERTEHTLQAIYVLQLATGVATSVIAIPVFYLLGYEYFLTLAIVCGILQFVPIVGPSVVLLALAAYHVSVGEIAAAAAVLGIGGVLIAILPDAVVRPYLARASADMPATLYLVGFIGGLLSLGPVGIVAGPLAVALLSEAVELLGTELRNGQ